MKGARVRGHSRSRARRDGGRSKARGETKGHARTFTRMRTRTASSEPISWVGSSEPLSKERSSNGTSRSYTSLCPSPGEWIGARCMGCANAPGRGEPRPPRAPTPHTAGAFGPTPPGPTARWNNGKRAEAGRPLTRRKAIRYPPQCPAPHRGLGRLRRNPAPHRPPPITSRCQRRETRRKRDQQRQGPHHHSRGSVESASGNSNSAPQSGALSQEVGSHDAGSTVPSRQRGSHLLETGASAGAEAPAPPAVPAFCAAGAIADAAGAGVDDAVAGGGAFSFSFSFSLSFSFSAAGADDGPAAAADIVLTLIYKKFIKS